MNPMSDQSDLLDKLQSAFSAGRIQWQKHALTKMLERGITRTDVIFTIKNGEVIEYYPTDRPFPSALILKTSDNRTLHVVTAYDVSTAMAFVITTYMPDQRHFLPDCRTRRLENE